jgi:small-conductance mechanosensitive channel
MTAMNTKRTDHTPRSDLKIKPLYQGVEKQESGRQARRAAMRQAQHIQAYVSIGESRATLNGGLGRSFSTACYSAGNFLRVCLGIFLLLAACASLATGENAPEASPRVPEPIQLTEVATRAIEASNSLRDIHAQFSPVNEIEDIKKNLPDAIARMATQKQRTMEALQEEQALVWLQDEGKIWQKNQVEMVKWQNIITQRDNQLQSVSAQLADLQKIWNQTLVSARAAKAPEEIIQQIDTVLQSIRAEQTSLQTERSAIIDLLSRVAEGAAQSGTLLAEISQAQRNMVMGISSSERLPIWSAKLWAQAHDEGFARLHKIAESIWADVEFYLFAFSSRMQIHLGFFICMSALFFMIRKKVNQWTAEEHSEAIAILVDYPFAAALIITLFLASSPYFPLPKTVLSLFEILLLAATIRLIKPMVDPRMVSGLYALGVLYTLDMIRNAFGPAPLFDQSLIVAEALAGIAILGWSLTYGNLKSPFVKSDRLTRLRALGLGAIIMLIILGAGFVAGVLGHLLAARFLVSGVFRTCSLALELFVLIKIISGMAAFSLRVRPLRFLRMVDRHRNLLERRIYKVLVWAASFAFLTRFLEYTGLFQPAVSIGKAILAAKLERGAISISLGDILAFVLCICVSYLLSSFICFVLEQDVYPRTKVPHGIAYAASRIIRYSIMAVGFVLGIGLLGMDLTQLTVVVGAFSVGIGFGLQSVVNNFVSGLILLFERPIHANDIVEVQNIQGVVKQIGIRASILKTFQGAEIIIPNSQLVSDQVTNWTFSDKRRRIELPVSVNYSAAPRKVIEVLSDVASDHPRILKHPTPQALLTGFGDNGVNFELRVWTDEFNNWPVIRSELAEAVYDAIHKAGMSFPFPQREVRLLQEKEA